MLAIYTVSSQTYTNFTIRPIGIKSIGKITEGHSIARMRYSDIPETLKLGRKAMAELPYWQTRFVKVPRCGVCMQLLSWELIFRRKLQLAPLDFFTQLGIQYLKTIFKEIMQRIILTTTLFLKVSGAYATPERATHQEGKEK